MELRCKEFRKDKVFRNIQSCNQQNNLVFYLICEFFSIGLQKSKTLHFQLLLQSGQFRFIQVCSSFCTAQMNMFHRNSKVIKNTLHCCDTTVTNHVFNEYLHYNLSLSLSEINSILVFPCLVGFPSSFTPTKVILSMVMIVWRVIIFLTWQASVIEVWPKLVASIPISMISPWRAELIKLISEMYLVTQRGVSSCTIA